MSNQLLWIIIINAIIKSKLGNKERLGYKNAFDTNAEMGKAASIADSMPAFLKIKETGNKIINITIITFQFFRICITILFVAGDK